MDKAGGVVDAWDRGRRSETFKFLDLIGKKIVDVAIESQKAFVAIFADGYRLRVIDNSDQNESFSVGSLFV